MPRINIEDVWWDDPRRDLLANASKSKQLADGIAIGFWKLAQTWHRVSGAIPADIFERVPFWSEFVQCGLAKRVDAGYYVCGRNEYFQWLSVRSESGRKGGNAAPKQTEANVSKAKQVEPSYSYSSSPSYSSSSSFSDSHSKKEESAEPSKAEPTRPSRARARGCVDAFAGDPIAGRYLGKVTHDVQQAWLDTYPGADWILGEIRQAHVWIMANPQKASKDFGRFMSNWLGRSFERHRKGIPSRRLTQSEVNMQAIGDLYRKVNES